MTIPIEIVPYDPTWPEQFEAEKQRIASTLMPLTPAIRHVGSTAVPGLRAKPTIDILIGLTDFDATADDQIPKFEAMGYDYWSIYEDEFPNRRLFCLEPEQFVRRFNVHMVEKGSQFWKDHLRFRDILRNDPEVRDAYQKLKEELAPNFTFDTRNDYAEAKTEFIVGVMERGGL